MINFKRKHPVVFLTLKIK